MGKLRQGEFNEFSQSHMANNGLTWDLNPSSLASESMFLTISNTYPRVDSLEKTLMLGGIGGRRRRG